MANIGKVVIIGTVLWWPWSTLAQWSSLAQCFGCHGQHWHNGHHWHNVLVVMDIIGTVDIIDTVFWLSWTSLAQCLVAMVNIGTMVIIGTVVQRNKTLMLSVVMACTSSSTISLVASDDIFTSRVFCQGTQTKSSQRLHFIFVIWKNLLNKQSIWSRFIKLCYEGDMKNNQWTIWIVWCFLCSHAQALKQTV